MSSVRDALIQIILRLRDDVLKDKEGGHNPSGGSDSVYSGAAGLSVPSLLHSVPSIAPLSYEQRAETAGGVGILSSSSLYGYGSLSVSHLMMPCYLLLPLFFWNILFYSEDRRILYAGQEYFNDAVMKCGNLFTGYAVFLRKRCLILFLDLCIPWNSFLLISHG